MEPERAAQSPHEPEQPRKRGPLRLLARCDREDGSPAQPVEQLVVDDTPPVAEAQHVALLVRMLLGDEDDPLALRVVAELHDRIFSQRPPPSITISSGSV